MGEERIEIPIEVTTKNTSAISKTTEDLKKLESQAASTGQALASSGKAVDELGKKKPIKTSISYTVEDAGFSKAQELLKKPLKSSIVYSTVTEDPAFTKAQELLKKPLKTSMAVTTITEDPAFTKAKELAKKPLRSSMTLTSVTEDPAFTKAKELTAKPLRSSMVVTAVTEDPAFTKAKELAKKPLRSSMVFTTVMDDSTAKSDKARLTNQANYWNAYYKDQANAIKQTNQATQEYGSTLGEVGSLVKTAFSSYLVYQFLGTLKNATSAVLEWMGNMETYGIAIAASLQVGGKYVDSVTGKAIEGQAAFALAQQDAVGVIEALQVANFQTVATLDQLIRMYQEALPIAMKKGFDKKMVQEFTLSVTQAASAMGVSMDMMAEEARSLLTGAINMRNSRVAVALGITPEDVRQNSASADQLFSFLMGKLQVYRTAGEALQNSWRGLWSNFKDVMMQAGGKALEPLFEGIKAQLKDIVESIVTLDTAAGKIKWNPEFLEMINAIRDAVKDAWYYAQLLKEVGDAGAGAVKAISKSGAGDVIDGMNPQKVVQNALKGELPLIPGAIWDLVSGKGWDNRAFKIFEGFSAEPIKDYFKDRELSAGKFAAKRTMAESGMSEREIADIHLKNAAEKYGVPVEDLAGVAFAENNFRNTMSAKDKDGKRAYGYMQLRESTAAGLGLGIKDIMDPEKNIDTGAKYYKQLLDMFGGDRVKAMESYNKGQGFIQKYDAGEYSDPNKTYKVYGKIQTADDLKKNAKEAEEYYRKASKYSDDLVKSQYYGLTEGSDAKRQKVEFEQQIGMTELNQKGWQEAYKKQIELAHTTNTAELKEADDMGKDMKKNLRLQLLSTEQIKQQEAEIDDSTLQQKLQANEKYLKSYRFFTDEVTNLKDKEGKGVFGREEDKDTFESKSVKDLAKIEEEVRGNRRQLGILDVEETNRANTEARGKDLEAKKEKVGNAQWEYDNLKKLNDLKVSLNLATPSETFETELASQRRLLEAKKALIEFEQSQPQDANKRAQLASDLIKIENELGDVEKTKLERAKTVIQTDEIKQKKLEALTTAEIGYRQVVGDPSAVESLSKRLEITKLSFAADTAQKENLHELAAAYRKTAAALSELNSGPDIFVGFKTALRDMTNEIGSATKQWTELFKGVFDDLKTGLSSGIYDFFRGNLNFNKSAEFENVRDRIKANEAQKERLELQKEEIENNDALSESQKKVAKDAIDLQIKQLDAAADLLKKQEDAVSNSKGIEDLWQGFLDSLTKKISDFLASSIVMEFIAFLSGKSFGSSALGGLFGLGTSATEGGGGGGGGGGGILGLLGMGEKGASIWDKGSKLWGWLKGGDTASALAANPSFGADLAGTSGFEAGSGALEGIELSSYAGMEVGSGAVGTTMTSEAGLAALELGSGAAVEGGAGAMSGLGGMANMAWLGPAAYAVGWLYTAYKVYEGAQDMAKNNEAMAKQRIVGGINSLSSMSGEFAGQDVTTPASEGGGGLKTLGEGATNAEKLAFIQSYIQEMRLYGKEAKLTEDQISELITKAISPQNEEMRKSADLMNRISTTTIDMNGNIVTSVENMAAMRNHLAGMNQTALESLPNLGSYGTILRDIGISYDTFNSQSIDAALLTADLAAAFGMLTDGIAGTEIDDFNKLLAKMKGAVEQNGESIFSLIPGIERFADILAMLGVNINSLPTNKTITINTVVVGPEVNPNSVPEPPPFHTGGFVGRFHKGGFLKYHPWGGSLGSDEVPIIAQKGEYVLSRKDVEFINKVKGGGGSFTEVINMPPILPRVNVIVNNQSAAQIASTGSIRYSDDQYIVDVLLKDLHSNGRLRHALSFG